MLQWVFLSMGLASAGVGTWLQLTPIAGKRRGGVTARLEF
jgi:hypothetical protein